MHFSFSLLSINDLYMFRALFVHPQEVLHKQHLVCCVHIISVGCGTVAVSLQPCMFNCLIVMHVPFCVLLVCKCALYYCHQLSTQLQLNIYVYIISTYQIPLCSASREWAKLCSKHVEALDSHTINWMKSASRWFHYTDILWCTVNKTYWRYSQLSLIWQLGVYSAGGLWLMYELYSQTWNSSRGSRYNTHRSYWV
jgi:hypothetical protein